MAGPAGPAAGDMVAVGRIGRAHGLRGEMALDSWTDDPQDRFAPGSVLTWLDRGGQAEQLTIATARWHSGRWLITAAGIADRSAAEAMRGTVLLVAPRDRLPIEDPNEFYDSDLIGLSAQAPDGVRIGVVSEVVHGPGGDYLAVTDSNGAEHLVPFVAAIVPTVDVGTGHVVIDAPEGLFEL